MMPVDHTELEKTIGYTFNDRDLLVQALTHRSFTNEHRTADHNERLEFLGDAILQYISTRTLYTLYPEENEGNLSVYRSRIVSTDFLMRAAETLEIRKYTRVSEGQKKDLSKANLPLIADAVESLIGAIYLDGGLKEAESFIQTHLFTDITAYLAALPLRDPKTELQERTQQRDNITPIYTVIRQLGPDHDKRFTVAVKVNGTVLAKATGKSKQEAERKAAKKALEQENNH